MAAAERSAQLRELLRRSYAGTEHAVDLDRAKGLSFRLDGVPTSVVALTSPFALAQEIRDTESLLHPSDGPMYEVDPEESSVSLHSHDTAAVSCKQLTDELMEISEYGRSRCLSTQEQTYRAALHETLAATLAQAVLATMNDIKISGSKSKMAQSEVCVCLLELVVRHSSIARELAFTVMEQLLTTANELLLQTQGAAIDSNHPLDSLHGELFGLYADMLVKAIVVASNSASASPIDELQHETKWTIPASTCLLMFTKTSGSYKSERLMKLDAQSLVQMLRLSIAGCPPADLITEVHEELLEAIICVLYLQHAPRSDPSGQLRDQLAVRLTDVEKLGGIDLFVFWFFNVPSERSRRLLLVLFFDLTIDQMMKKKLLGSSDSWAPYEALLGCFHQSGVASFLHSHPLAFAKFAADSVVERLHAFVENELLESQVQTFYNTFQDLLQLDEFFVRSNSLANAMKLLADNQQTSLADALVSKTHQLLISSRVEDRFKGERWLSELLLLGVEMTPSTTSSCQKSSDETSLLGGIGDVGASKSAAGEELEETFCFDEMGEIRLAARVKFWELCKSQVPGMRLSFIRVLSLVTKRRVQLTTSAVAMSRHLREINTCLAALASQEEDNTLVIATAMELLLGLCIQDVSYMDRGLLEYDVRSSTIAGMEQLRGKLFGSDTSASCILRGVVSIDPARASEISMEFLLHALSIFDSAIHAPSACLGACCGVTPSAAGDLLAVTALLVSYCMRNPKVCQQVDVIGKLTPYLDACDTRVAVLLAHCLRDALKSLHGLDQYSDVLREMHAIAVQQDDETLLANTYAHVRALLHPTIGHP